MAKNSILGALLRKEILMLKRNPFIPRVIVMLPIMVMLVIPLVANLDVKHVGVDVVDNDRSQLSRRIAADIDASEYLTVTGHYDTYEEALQSLERGKSDVILTIPPHYERDMESGRFPKIDLAANGVNATKGALGANYTIASVANTLRQSAAMSPGSLTSAAAEADSNPVSVMYMYNPTLNFRNFMVPALMVMLVIIICGFLPTLNLVSEKEKGTIEAMNVTPVGRMTFVMSKLIPYWVIGLLVVSIAILIGWLVYGLIPVGSVLSIYLAAVLITLVMSGLGLIIANKSATVLQSILMMFAVIMVCQLMSGLFTPIFSMPQWAQLITYAVPPRYFIEIVRAVYLKGTPLSELWMQFVILAAMGAFLCATAAATYRKRN